MTATLSDRAETRTELERLRGLLRRWLGQAAEGRRPPPPDVARLAEDTKRALLHCGPGWGLWDEDEN